MASARGETHAVPRLRLVASLLVVASLGLARTARADETPPEHRIHWDESHPRFRTWEYVATGASMATFLAFEKLTPVPTESSWSRGLLFDDAARSFFVGKSRTVRDRANDLSDWFTYAPQIYSAAVDPLLTFTVLDGTFDVAWQMTAMNFEVYGSVGLLVRIGELEIPRLRPATVACRSDPQYEAACNAGPAASFPSGHSALAFVGAGLACAHHLHLDLYGSAWGDGAACGLAMATASTSAVLRLVADRHWASDVILGSVLGAGGGYFLPTLLHYAPTIETGHDATSAKIVVAPLPSVDALGVGALGVF